MATAMVAVCAAAPDFESDIEKRGTPGAVPSDRPEPSLRSAE